MKRVQQTLLTLVASFGLVACAETDFIMSELNEAEAEDFAGAVLAAAFTSTNTMPQQSAQSEGPALVPYSFSSSINTDVPCALGGMVGVSASVEVSGDTESQGGYVDYEMVQIHDGCVVMSEDGRQFTLFGNPNVSLEVGVEHDGQGGLGWQGALEGSVDWQSDGREGSCSVDLDFAGSLQVDQRVAGELSGVVCGVEVTRAFAIG